MRRRLREGLEDMFTVRRLGVGGRLAASLTNTNCRLEGYRQMPTFVAALARHVEAVTPACDAARVA
jgi:hypothetical protein